MLHSQKHKMKQDHFQHESSHITPSTHANVLSYHTHPMGDHFIGFLGCPIIGPLIIGPMGPIIGPIGGRIPTTKTQVTTVSRYCHFLLVLLIKLLNWSYFLKCISTYNTIQALFPWLTRDLFPKFPIFFYKYNEYEIIYLASYP